MSQLKYWTKVLLLLVILIPNNIDLVYCNDMQNITINNDYPTHASDYSIITIYGLDGRLDYLLVAKHIEYFSKQGISWITNPTLTAYDINKMSIWSIKSDYAKLIHDSSNNMRYLYLYGHIEMNSLAKDIKLRKIIANNAQLNLVTHDISSYDLIILYGTTFKSKGLNMVGNLRNKKTMLIKKVRTSYAIKNK